MDNEQGGNGDFNQQGSNYDKKETSLYNNIYPGPDRREQETRCHDEHGIVIKTLDQIRANEPRYIWMFIVVIILNVSSIITVLTTYYSGPAQVKQIINAKFADQQLQTKLAWRDRKDDIELFYKTELAEAEIRLKDHVEAQVKEILYHEVSDRQGNLKMMREELADLEKAINAAHKKTQFKEES